MGGITLSTNLDEVEGVERKLKEKLKLAPIDIEIKKVPSGFGACGVALKKLGLVAAGA